MQPVWLFKLLEELPVSIFSSTVFHDSVLYTFQALVPEFRQLYSQFFVNENTRKLPALTFPQSPHFKLSDREV